MGWLHYGGGSKYLIEGRVVKSVADEKDPWLCIKRHDQFLISSVRMGLVLDLRDPCCLEM